jgi:hypothetical protein
MRVEWRMFTAMACFILAPGVIYWIASHEHAGGVLMVLLAVSFFFLGAWLLTESRHIDPRPEDDPRANPQDQPGDVGFFPTGSVWPATLALGAVIVGYGLAFSAWLAVPGLIMLALAIIGFTAESQRSI